MNIQTDSKVQDISQRKKTVATSERSNVTTVILKNITYETVISQRNHRIMLQPGVSLEKQSD